MISVYKQGKLIFVASDELEGLITMYDGWTPTVKIELATGPGMRALRDELLRRGHKDAAAAVDNAIELVKLAIAQEFTDVKPHYIVTKAWTEKHLNSEADLEKMGDGKTEVSNNGYKPV
jgi:hypothetical protein